jgi:hypothetical protein
MAVGKLAFADPSDLFDYLKTNSAEVFIPGVQNDFHEIFTLLIDRMSDGFKEVSPEEAKLISKLLFGKMLTKIDFLEVVRNRLRARPASQPPSTSSTWTSPRAPSRNHSRNGNATK